MLLENLGAATADFPHNSDPVLCPNISSCSQLAVQAVSDGDKNDELCKDEDANGKRNLCNALNKDAIRKRDAALERQFHDAAIAVLRGRVVDVEDPSAVQSCMESPCRGRCGR